jgi:hypothetical protein
VSPQDGRPLGRTWPQACSRDFNRWLRGTAPATAPENHACFSNAIALHEETSACLTQVPQFDSQKFL